MTHFPATLVRYPETVEGNNVAFFLATEEYLAKHYPAGNYFFIWQVPPTCIFGHNQNPEAELDLDFCRRNNVRLCRRKSGGGTVFADQNNLMLSLVTESVPVEDLYSEYAHTVAATLQRLGAPTQVSGRNDIETIDHHKICGNAFYRLPRRNIVHGTMLYDTDLPLMTGALTPPEIKLQRRGVKSVKSRIGLLKDYIGISIEELKQFLAENLTSSEITLSAHDMEAIREIEQTYYSPAYLWGHRDKNDVLVRKGHVEGCGNIAFELDIRQGKIFHITLTGDYFETCEKNAEASFREALIGVPYELAIVHERLIALQPTATVRNLSVDDAENILFNLYDND